MEDKNEFHTFRGYQMRNQENKPLTLSMEDYLEMIYRNCREEGYVRTNQLAQYLNVKPSSTTKIVQKLAALGFVDYQKYGIIQLTAEGESLGSFLLHRHNVTQKFLKHIGVEETLLKDTEMIEHHINVELLKNLEMFNRFLDTNPIIIEQFTAFKKSYLGL